MTTTEKETSPEQADHLDKIPFQIQDQSTLISPSPQASWPPCENSAEAQRQRLIDHIRRHGSITTIEARRDLDILHPGGRVMELRKAGEPIETIRVNSVTAAGKVHNVAQYILAGQGAEVKS